MFDIGWQELFIVGILALIVVGPKDLPKTIKMGMSWIRKARMLAREFQSGVDEMVREADLDDVKKQLTQGSEDLKKDLEKSVGTDIAKDLDLSDDETQKVISDADADLDLDEIMEPGDSAEADATAAASDEPTDAPVDDDEDVMPITETPTPAESKA